MPAKVRPIEAPVAMPPACRQSIAPGVAAKRLITRLGILLMLMLLSLMAATSLTSQARATAPRPRSVNTNGEGAKTPNTVSTAPLSPTPTPSVGPNTVDSPVGMGTPPPPVGGNIHYRTTSTKIAGVTVSVAGLSSMQSTTDANGDYVVAIFNSGLHTVTPSLSGQVNGISSFDAALIAQCTTGLRAMSDCPMPAADTSGNNVLSSFDAALIAQAVIGLADANSRVGRWVFDPANRSYNANTIPTHLLHENYAGYLIGEVSGNWQPPAATAAQQATSEQTAAPLTMATAADGTVTLSHTGVVSDLLAYQLTLHYDPSVGRLVAVIPAATVSTEAGWELVVNESTPGTVAIVGYGITPVNGTGALVTLRFHGAEGQVVDLSPTVVAVQLNEAAVWFNQEVRYQHFLPWIGAE